MSTEPTAGAAPRVFLVIVDNSPEVGVAVMYACLRALHCNGRVALLHVITPAGGADNGIGSWMGVGEALREEEWEEAEILIEIIAGRIRTRYGLDPDIYIREGRAVDQLIKLVNDHREISVLVLATSTGPDGPGPLTSFVASRNGQKLRLPVTLIPGSMTREELEAIS